MSLKIVMMLCGVSAATFQSAMTTRILQELISKVTILPSAPVAFPMCLHYNFLLIYLWSTSQSVSQSTNLPISPFVCSFLGLKHALKSKSAVSLPFGPSVAQDLNTPSSPSGAPVTRPEIIANINADATAAFLGCGIPLEALKGMPTSTLEALKHAIRNVVAAFEVQTVKHKETLNFFESLQVACVCDFWPLDPPLDPPVTEFSPLDPPWTPL